MLGMSNEPDDHQIMFECQLLKIWNSLYKGYFHIFFLKCKLYYIVTFGHWCVYASHQDTSRDANFTVYYKQFAQ